jgi:hypothetical protein
VWNKKALCLSLMAAARFFTLNWTFVGANSVVVVPALCSSNNASVFCPAPAPRRYQWPNLYQTSA